jgi:hypothetical protein
MNDNTAEVLTVLVLIIGVLILGMFMGDSVGTKTFIMNNYGKEFTVIEKTIRADEFSYKITDGKEKYDFSTKDDLEMNSVITIGVK